MLLKSKIFFAVFSVTFIASALSYAQNSSEEIKSAVVVLNSVSGSNVSGVIHFVSEENGVRVTGEVSGLSAGNHGFHIHQFGDCSSSDGKSAGGHFNPEKSKHGAPNSDVRHVGDLGNISANEDGVAKIDFVDSVISLSGKNSIIGRAIIIHADADDLESQPTGNAGGRVACGVIGIAK